MPPRTMAERRVRGKDGMESLLLSGGGMRDGFDLYCAMACTLLAFSGTSREGAAVEQVPPVPLSGSLGRQIGDRSYGVYVPTRHGGILAIKSSAGKIEALTGPDGRPRTNG